MSTIKYLVELSQRTQFPPDLALASAYYDRSIYTIHTGRPTGTYWTDWNGSYDNPISNDVQLFFKYFLQQVFNESDLKATEYSFYCRTTNIIDINLSIKPWQYYHAVTELLQKYGYLSAVPDSTHPERAYLINSIGHKVKYPVMLEVPSFTIKLNDPISGETRYGTFKVNLINNDGRFDLLDDLDNTPITIKRSDVEVPEMADFHTIRQGLVDYLSISGNRVSITSAEYIRLFIDQVCRTFSTDLYENLNPDLIGNNIPIGYGPLKDVTLIQIDQNEGIDPRSYLALDTDYITAVSAVYNKDKESILFNFTDGLIVITVGKIKGSSEKDDDNTGTGSIKDVISDGTVLAGEYAVTCTADGGTATFSVGSLGSFSITNTDEIIKTVTIGGITFTMETSGTAFIVGDNFTLTFDTEEAETCDCTGYADNTIGQIITREIEIKSNTPYTSSNWDTEETNYYNENSAGIGLYVNSGTVRDLISTALKNDSAFLFTQNSGLLTIRQWGLLYGIHKIPSWQIMKIPTKNTQESKKLQNSSVRILYDKSISSNVFSGSLLDTSRELELEERYRKIKRSKYQTVLLNSADAQSLATLMLNRFGVRPEIISKLQVGYNTTGVNLLDTVVLDVIINGRRISKKLYWVVTEINPAQDEMTLWSIEDVPEKLGYFYGSTDTIFGYDEFGHGYKE